MTYDPGDLLRHKANGEVCVYLDLREYSSGTIYYKVSNKLGEEFEVASVAVEKLPEAGEAAPFMTSRDYADERERLRVSKESKSKGWFNYDDPENYFRCTACGKEAVPKTKRCVNCGNTQSEWFKTEKPLPNGWC